MTAAIDRLALSSLYASGRHGGGSSISIEHSIERGFGWGLGSSIVHHLPMGIAVGVVIVIVVVVAVRRVMRRRGGQRTR